MPQPRDGADQDQALRTAVSDAVLTEAVRHVDIIHTSLAGMTAIVVTLLSAVALPVFGFAPVTHPFAFGIMFLAAFTGIGGLYVLNFRAHQHVADQARLTEVLVNSLGQGFLVFGRDGMCGKVYSQACLDLLETVPAGQNISDVLRVPPDQRSDFNDWLDVLYQPHHALGFDDVVRFLPQYFAHSKGRRVNLTYRPSRQRDGSLINVVMIATDQTEEYAAQLRAKERQDFAETICRIFKERNQFQMTLSHVRGFLETAAAPTVSLRDASEILRQLHTLKASVKHFNLLKFGDVIHAVEHDLRQPEIRPDDDSFRRALREGTRKISESLSASTADVSDLLGLDQDWRGNIREIGESDLYDFARTMQAQNVDPVLIKQFLATIAAVPIRECLQSFERSLRELAGVVDKQIKPVQYLGTNPRVLARPIQDFLFSLTHISRNIMDHGIEPPVARMAQGKDPAGQVTVLTEVLTEGSSKMEWLHIVIRDDGNGINPSRVRAKLAMLDPQGTWMFEDDRAVIQRIFSWGFSTSEQVTTLSGRGVGLEAVKQEVLKLGGTIRVESELYKGATFDIRIPHLLDITLLTKTEARG